MNEILNKIITFTHSKFTPIRFVYVNDKPYAIGKDFALSMGYYNSRDALNRHCRNIAKHKIYDEFGSSKYMSIIAINDMYRLIFRCNNPHIEEFEEWIVTDVIPKLDTEEVFTKDELLDNPEILINLLKEVLETKGE